MEVSPKKFVQLDIELTLPCYEPIYTFANAFGTSLTLLELPGFDDFRKKNSSFRLPYQRPSSSADCARELFSSSNGSASLVDCTRKKIFWLGGVVFL